MKRIAKSADVQNLYYITQDACRHLFNQRKLCSAKDGRDAGITIDVEQAAREIDCVVLLSTDGDFRSVAEKV